MSATPDAHRAGRCGAVRHGWLRLISALLTALIPVVGAVPARAEVSPADIASAESEAAAAIERLQTVERELVDAERQRGRIAASLDRIGEQIAAQTLDLGEERAEARARLAGIYMRAGSGDGLLVFSGHRISDFPAQVAYLGAVADQDRELIGRLIASRADLDRLSGEVARALAAQETLVADLKAAVEVRRSEVDAARRLVGELESEWQRQEEERRRREEEERRRREEEARRQAEAEEAARQEAEQAVAAAVATAAAAGWSPGSGVGAWRPLVQRYFPERLVEEALRVMACESDGNPLLVNPYSGAAGLFQHLPYYWPSRAANAGWAGADILDPEANIAVSAWLVLESEEAGRDSWAHWTCKP